MSFNRRKFLKYAIVGGSMLGANGVSALLNARVNAGMRPKAVTAGASTLDYRLLDPRQTKNFTIPLRTPRSRGLLGFLDIPAGPLKIAAGPGTLEIIEGISSPVQLYRAQGRFRRYQNPILRIKTGDKFNVVFRNNLQAPSIIHWHGIFLDGRSDGNPLQVIEPGASYDYHYTMRNRSGTYWYHPHPHMQTASQAFSGLSSFLIVEDEDELSLREQLGLTLGQNDLPLLLQDKRFGAQGQLTYAPNATEKLMGYFGNVIVVNFTPNASLEAGTSLYRFRLLNGSTARTYNLAFTQRGAQIPYWVIGTDGGLMDAPYQVNNQFISPGERLDILLDLSDLRVGEVLFLESLAFDPMENESMAPMGDAIGNGTAGNPLLSGEAFNIMKIIIKRRAKAASPLPRGLSTIRPIDITDASFRRIKLTMNRMQWLINGQSYQLDAFPIHVRQNTVEIWEIVNDPMSMPHPMHLHGFQFQVLERLGSPPQINRLAVDSMGRMVSDLGWRDTIMVWPGETVRIAIDFSHNFSGDQNYVFHCHNLEHEDNGMMVNYTVKAASI